MLRTWLCLVPFLTATSILLGQDADANRILAKYDAMRPTANELSMYRLDWAESLEQAIERAARESRPVLLVVIHAKYGDITAGHC